MYQAYQAEIGDILHLTTKDGAMRPFEVVTVVTRASDQAAFAVAHCEPENAFIITLGDGTPLEDKDLSEEILGHFKDNISWLMDQDVQ